MAKDNFQNKPQDKQRDTLFAKPQDMIVDFEFDDSVAAVFSDMIRRSVPGYATLVTLTGLLAEQYVRPKSRVYDLGCSLGAITLSVLQRIANIDCQMLAVDNSQSMVERCQQNLPEDTGNATVEVRCADMQDVEIRQASIVVINLTLQFVDPALRSKLLANIYQGLLPGGALILSEKIVFDNAQEQQFQENMHIAFKKANAYSELEISQKRTALENVLIPDSIETHIDRLRKAGFESVHQWFQCFNFVSLIAIK
jgi:tRNA (cmo5U34)-methyltransferase